MLIRYDPLNPEEIIADISKLHIPLEGNSFFYSFASILYRYAGNIIHV